MANTLVNPRNVYIESKEEVVEYGHSTNAREKKKLKRLLRSREEQEFQKFIREGEY